MKKIIILGCSSFSGATMTDFLLKKKYNVIGTFNQKKPNLYLKFNKNKNIKNFKNIKINLLNKKDRVKLIKIINYEKPNVIIDFASICMVNESWKNPNKYFKINLLSKIEILNHVKDMKFIKKYIYISTPEVFGSNKESIKESNLVFKPSTPYAESKLSCENYIKLLIKNSRFNGIIARFSNFYGPGQPYYRLIPKIIMSILNKKKFPLHGNGKSKRNFIYSNDFCNGIHKIITKGATGKIYHFSGNKLYTVKEVVKKVSKLMNSDFKKTFRMTKDRQGKDLIYNLNSKMTQKTLKWSCKTDIHQGILNIIDYTLKNLNSAKKLPTNYKVKK